MKAESAPESAENEALRRRIAEVQQELARERQAHGTLLDVAQALGAALDLDRLLELILSKTTTVLQADRATLYLIDDVTGELASCHVAGGKVRTIRLRVGEGIAGVVVQTGQPIRVDDAYQDNRFNPEWDALTGYRTKAILAVPMKNHMGKCIGVLQVLNRVDGGGFSNSDEGLLGLLATQAAISIDNAKLYQAAMQKNIELETAQAQLERKVADLKLLFDLERQMASAGTQDELIRAVLGRTLQATRTRAASALVRDVQRSGFSLYLLRAEPSPELHRRSVDAPSGVWAEVLRDGCTQNIEDVRAFQKEHGPILDDGGVLGFEATCALAVPLEGDDGTMQGALAFVDRRKNRRFLTDDVELLRLIAANVSTAISLQQARESREMSERLSTIGRLLSSVLHDLKTPMTVISGYVQLLSQATNPKQREEYSELVMKQFEHITAMQREVLAFARGERSLFLSRVYVAKFFEEVRSNIERELEGRPVRLVLVLEDRGIARFDEGKITRAIHNLVRNAIEAMSENGGVITLRVLREDDDLVIVVSDTGPGIPKEVEATLFQSFVTARKTGGTGLGLAIVKKVVEEHGGTVSAGSSPQGAAFTIRLPQSSPALKT